MSVYPTPGGQLKQPDKRMCAEAFKAFNTARFNSLQRVFYLQVGKIPVGKLGEKAVNGGVVHSQGG